ncbi:MAG TPA: hypothetical protein VM370_07810 [Candidatus Thermoplasmatota archaeon]|nr:hypothetical protein [Candidatus Thermoplasmatota archaeon]
MAWPRLDRRVVALVYVAAVAPIQLTIAMPLAARLATLAVGALYTLVLAALSRPLGRLLSRVWRTLGVALERRFLAHAAAKHGPARIVLTGRADRAESEWLQLVEATAFVAGLDVMVLSLARLVLPLQGLAGLAAFVGTLSFAMTLVVVPHWAFTRIGARRLDPARFLATPLADDYSRRTRVANGAFFLLALSVSTAALRHLGVNNGAAYREVILVAWNLAGLAALVCSAAIRDHASHRAEEDEALARAARELGCVDARALSDEELARLIAA